MNKPIINGEAQAFLIAFAVAAILFGGYTLLGTLVLKGDERLDGGLEFAILLVTSGAALGSALIALAVIANRRVGGWWLLASAVATVAWWGSAHLLAV